MEPTVTDADFKQSVI